MFLCMIIQMMIMLMLIIISIALNSFQNFFLNARGNIYKIKLEFRFFKPGRNVPTLTENVNLTCV